MAIFTDDFTDTNGTANYTRSGWSQIGTGSGIGAEIQSNEIRLTGDSDGRFNAHDHGGADHYAQATLGAGAVGSYWFLVGVRASGRTSAYSAAYNTSSSKWEIWNGQSATIAIAASTSTQAVGDVVRLEASGTSITLKINGSTVVTATHSGLTATSVGFSTDFNTSKYDWFRDWESGLLSDVGGGSTFVPQVIMVL